MPTSNRIEDLHPDLARVYAEAKAAYIAAHPGGLRPRLGETARPAAVQTAYYAQGRQPLAEINRLRHIAGLAPIGTVEAGRKITNAQAGQSPHGFLPARAFDVQLQKPSGEIDWTESAYTGFAAYVKVAAEKLHVAVSIGAYWPKFKDTPHTELLNWRKM
jgi:hypothetical protein